MLLETSAVNDKACRGDVISINCSADAVPSVTAYQLFENDSLILDTSGMWSKTFTTEGKFVYKCVANNSLGTGESASVTVTVNGNFVSFSFVKYASNHYDRVCKKKVNNLLCVILEANCAGQKK